MFFILYFILCLQGSTYVSSAEIVNPDPSQDSIKKLRTYLNRIRKRKNLNVEQNDLIIELINKCQQLNENQINIQSKLSQNPKNHAINLLSKENLLVSRTRKEWKVFLSPINESYKEFKKLDEENVKQVAELEELMNKDTAKTIFF